MSPGQPGTAAAPAARQAGPDGPGPGDTRLRIDISYDGTGFHGWSRQPGLRTVQQVLEEALARALSLPSPAPLTVAGRTDAGVHARGQVAHADVPEAAWAAGQVAAARCQGAGDRPGPWRIRRQVFRALAALLLPRVRRPVRARAAAPPRHPGLHTPGRPRADERGGPRLPRRA